MIKEIANITKLDDHELDLFRKSVNALFTGSFLIRSVDSDRVLFRFVVSNYELFEAYFDCAGWSLRKDENLGIVSWHGPRAARLNLGLEETLSLLVLRLLYEERRNDIHLHDHPAIHQQDFQERYRVVTDRVLKKTRLREILRRFQALKLVRNMGDETNPETLILLYPTLAFALDGQSIDDIHSHLETLGKQEDREDDTAAETMEGPEDEDAHTK
ncbi:MAG: DUF4194 domain-containing protein [bacterium]|nr:DUF4194 domain-containing protein [bacterium]